MFFFPPTEILVTISLYFKVFEQNSTRKKTNVTINLNPVSEFEPSSFNQGRIWIMFTCEYSIFGASCLK